VPSHREHGTTARAALPQRKKLSISGPACTPQALDLATHLIQKLEVILMADRPTISCLQWISGHGSNGFGTLPKEMIPVSICSTTVRAFCSFITSTSFAELQRTANCTKE